MEVDIKGVHFDLKDETKDLIDKKLERVAFAEEYIVNLDFTLTKEKKEFELEAKMHFRWGKDAVVKTTSFDLKEGLDKLMDKLEMKVRKEKDKITDRS